jgi:hypothetical protein
MVELVDTVLDTMVEGIKVVDSKFERGRHKRWISSLLDKKFKFLCLLYTLVQWPCIP